MTLAFHQFLITFGVPLALGVALLRLIGISWRNDRLAYLGWVYVSGSFVLGLLLVACVSLGWPIDPVIAPVVFSAIAAAIYALGARRPCVGASTPDPLRRERGLEWTLFYAALAIALAIVAQRIALANHLPIYSTDESHIWAAKAKALYLTQGFNQSFRELSVEHYRVGHPDYPVLNPLLQLWVFAQAGTIVHFENLGGVFGPATVVVPPTELEGVSLATPYLN